jgi:hypothetical protein
VYPIVTESYQNDQNWAVRNQLQAWNSLLVSLQKPATSYTESTNDHILYFSLEAEFMNLQFR